MKNCVRASRGRIRHWATRRLPPILAAAALQLAGSSYAHASTYIVPTSSESATIINRDYRCSLAEAIASANAGHQIFDDCEDLTPYPGEGSQIWLVESSELPYASNPFTVDSLTIDSPSKGVAISAILGTAYINTTGNSGFVIRAGSDVSFSQVALTYTGGIRGGRLLENYGTFRCYFTAFANGDVRTHNNGTGGAIYNAGVIDTMHHTTIQRNKAKKGGGIYNHGGTISGLFDVIIRGNQATMAGGGIYNAPSSSALGWISYTEALLIDLNLAPTGGGIFNRGLLNLTNTTISNNVASGTNSREVDRYRNSLDGTGGGIASMYFPDDKIGFAYTNLTGGTVSGNRASTGRGGAIAGDLYGVLNDVAVSNNGTQQCLMATGKDQYALMGSGCP